MPAVGGPLLNPLNGLSNRIPSQQPCEVDTTRIPFPEMRQWRHRLLK